MSWVSFLALFFITWWVVLFAILPFSLRTQDEDEDVTLGTVSSAPRGPHMLRAVLRTTIVTLVLAFIIFLLVKFFNNMRRKEEAKPAEPKEEVVLLREIRDSLKAR